MKENSNFFTSLPAIILSLLFWIAVYQALQKILPSKTPEYCCRIQTVIHAIIVSILGLRECFAESELAFYHPDWLSTPIQSFILVTSLGYFIHDLIWIVYYQADTKLMICHHIYSVLAMFRMLMMETSGAQSVCVLGSMESTNPLLQARWFLRSEGYYPSLMFTAVEYTFFFVFFLLRCVIGTYWIIILVFQPFNSWEYVMLSVAMYIISWLFLGRMTKYIIEKRLTGPKVTHESES